MKKDLYPHGSRELVDPKWSGAASKSNFARRDDGVPFTRFPRAQGHGQADDAQAPRLGQLGAHALHCLRRRRRERSPFGICALSFSFLSPPRAPLCRRCPVVHIMILY